VLLGRDQICAAQHRNMRGHRRLGDVEVLGELAAAHRPTLQQREYLAPGRLGDRLEHAAHS
jgi:hypothetical protein